MCRLVLAPAGEVHVTIKNGPPYSKWGVPALAAAAGFVLWEELPFSTAQWPGYKHQTTENGAVALDTDSASARKLLTTLAFRRKRRA
jgi:Domain of unknown function (DUF2431)